MLVLQGILPEVATVKLMLALGQDGASHDVATWMQTPIIDEFAHLNTPAKTEKWGGTE